MHEYNTLQRRQHTVSYVLCSCQCRKRFGCHPVCLNNGKKFYRMSPACHVHVKCHLLSLVVADVSEICARRCKTNLLANCFGPSSLCRICLSSRFGMSSQLLCHSVDLLPLLRRSGGLCGILLHPFTSSCVVLGPVLEVDLGNLGHQRVIGVWICEKRRDGKQDLGDGQSRAPLILQNV